MGKAGKRKGKSRSRYVPGQARLIALRKGVSPDQQLTGEQLTDLVIPDESILNTDETTLYDEVGKRFVAHEKVNHGEGEYVRGDAYTNTVEGLFANLKRQIKGTHHSISEEHSQRYLDEHAFRYNHRDESDGERFVRAVRGGVGKRLRLYKPKRGKAPSLWKRRKGDPAQDPRKRPRGPREAPRRRAGRRTEAQRHEASVKAALDLIAKKRAREDGDDE